MGREWDLPQEIMDIIAQHHGSTRIEYFYRKSPSNKPPKARPGRPAKEQRGRNSHGRRHRRSYR